jgi:hypothetical protein
MPREHALVREEAAAVGFDTAPRTFASTILALQLAELAD